MFLAPLGSIKYANMCAEKSGALGNDAKNAKLATLRIACGYWPSGSDSIQLAFTLRARTPISFRARSMVRAAMP